MDAPRNGGIPDMSRSFTRFASDRQLQAVYSVMRLLADDDRQRGTLVDSCVWCAACRRDCAAAGAVTYDGILLCNGCATEYEVLHIAGIVAQPHEFLAQGTVAATAG